MKSLANSIFGALYIGFDEICNLLIEDLLI